MKLSSIATNTVHQSKSSANLGFCAGSTLVVSGDGRYLTKPSVATIVRMAAANGVGKVREHAFVAYHWEAGGLTTSSQASDEGTTMVCAGKGLLKSCAKRLLMLCQDLGMRMSWHMSWHKYSAACPMML